MKVQIKNKDDGLVIVPETEFEEEYLQRFYPQEENVAYLKHGISANCLYGLVIKKKV